MSWIEKCLKYSQANGGALPPFKKANVLAHEQLDEYMQELTKAVIPEFHDKFITAAAYKLLYESRYNMLEPKDKVMCDWLVKTSEVISTESVVDEK